MRFLDTILDVVFPVNCVGCRNPGFDFCLTCIGEAPGNERENFPWIVSLFDYRHPPMKRALWLLKYKGRKRLARTFAENLYGRMLEEISDLMLLENFTDILLVPIPLSRRRGRERGYNQALLLAQEIRALDNGQNFTLCKDALIKTRDTPRQAHIENRRERLENVVGSFGIANKDKIKNRNIILIDDITTTGATLHEARKVLRAAGAKKVIAFTVAH